MEIEAKELMLGDWINYLPDMFGRVTELKTGENGEFVEVSFKNSYYKAILLKDDYFYPIPLTDDILKLNGWQFGTNGEWKKEKCLIELETGEEGGYYVYIGDSRVFVDSVHNLQHLLKFAGFRELADNFVVQ